MMMTDKIAYASEIRDRSPFIKTGLSCGTLFLCVAFRTAAFAVSVLLIMGYLTVRYSRVSFSSYIKVMLWPASFLVLGTLAVFFDISGKPGDLLNIPLAGKYLVMTSASAAYGTELILVALASVSCLYFLAVTTPVQDIIAVMRKIKVPWLIIEISLLMYRAIFIVADMAAAIMLAQECRLGNITFRRRIESMGMMLSVLLVRSMGRADRMYRAMEARGYDGEIRLLWEYRKASSCEKFLLVVYLLAMTAAGIMTVKYRILF